MDEFTLDLARELKAKYPKITDGFTEEEVAYIYSTYSEDAYAAGWMAPDEELVRNAFSKSPLAKKKKLIKDLEACRSRNIEVAHTEADNLINLLRHGSNKGDLG